MRIPAEALSAIRTELVQAHQCGVTGQHFEPTSALNSLLVELDYQGVEIVPKADARPDVIRVPKSDAGRVETRTPAPWVLASVMPGVVDIRPSSTVRDHVIEATATALLTRGDFSEKREIKVQTAWFCNEGGIEEATRDAVSLALSQARKGAAAFIAATASDRASTPGEAA
ncbi:MULTISPECIES: hypothetical protein [unclassified Methylobacterium]|uniref:hypothetical protein n=1 Tax=unclassified Methylobacterium TaxID=2615210 RepID=UPI0005BCB348|nr:MULTISPECIES: hypothetical protein [unclassified Methylobacterium]SFU51768.1 hypothetical protein SAMN02799643_01039 [Methylobacterium sp. UNCCL125]